MPTSSQESREPVESPMKQHCNFHVNNTRPVIVCMSKKGDSEMRTTNIRPSFRYTFTGLFLLFMAVSSPSFAQTEWNVGISGGSEGIDGFSLSIGEYYGVPESEVVVIHERGIYEEELPVVFFIARMAHVHPGAVVDLRLRGMSWMDITFYYGLRPDIYYVPVVIHHYGPPYGHAYGYYHRQPRGGWKRGDLRDRDIVNQVNLKFISEHHRYAPEQIMRSRNDGRSFRVIDRDIRNEKGGKVRNQKQGSAYRNDKRMIQMKQSVIKPDQHMKRVVRPNEYRQKQDVRKGNVRQGYVHNDKARGKR